MTDARLRELERRFVETGSPEDELAYLLAVVRSGEPLDWGQHFRLLELDSAIAAEHLSARVKRGELWLQKITDLYGIDDSRGLSRESLDRALALRFGLRDRSSYGDYYVRGAAENRTIQLQVVRYEPDSEDREADFPTYGTLIYVYGVADPDALRGPLLSIDGVEHLWRRD